MCKDMDGNIFSTGRTWPRRHSRFQHGPLDWKDYWVNFGLEAVRAVVAALHDPGWICAELEQILWYLFTTCLLVKLYHPACSWKAFVTLNNVYSLGPVNFRCWRVLLKGKMRLRPPSSALEVGVMQGGLVLGMTRKAGKLLPLGIALGLGEFGCVLL